MSEHSKFSASAMPRAVRCYGSVPMNAGRPYKTSRYAAEGTAAHELASWVLTEQTRPGGDVMHSAHAYLGRIIEADGFEFEVTEDMADAVDKYADACLMMANKPGTVHLIEQRLNYSRYIGVPEAEGWGTGDHSAVDDTTLHVNDLKYGMGVRVYADNNEQAICYGLGLLDRFDMVGDFETIRIGIHQPRLDHVDVWEISVKELLAHAEKFRTIYIPNILKAERVFADGGTDALLKAGLLQPGEKQCKFCDAKANCPAALKLVLETVGTAAEISEFEDLTVAKIPPARQLTDEQIGVIMDRADFMEQYVTSVRAEAERRLLSGIETLPSPDGGWHLVQGKRGHRKWANPEAVEQVLAKALGDAAYTRKLVSPAQAEKLKALKALPKLHTTLLAAGSVTQSEGKPHVARADDPRPKLTVVETFEPIEDAPRSLPAPGAHPFRR